MARKSGALARLRAQKHRATSALALPRLTERPSRLVSASCIPAEVAELADALD